MPPDARKIHDTLRDLPLDDKIAALIVSLIERRPDAVHSVISLIATIGVMTRDLGVERSYALAESLRDCADVIEVRATRRVVHVPID